MKRDEAINIITKYSLENLVKEDRESLLLDWWVLDEEDVEFDLLPMALQSELTAYDEPQRDTMSECYDVLLLVALKNKYIGVRNEYLAHKVSIILGSNHEVDGVLEDLYSCPCCKFKTILRQGEYDICSVCFWEDDGTSIPTNYSASNHMNLKQAFDNFIEYGVVNKAVMQFLEPDRLEMYDK